MLAMGTLARSLGQAGEIEPETEGMLAQYDIDSGEFPAEVLPCLPDITTPGSWKIPEAEFAYRRDFRQECLFTIDPTTARDLDDALHVKWVDDASGPMLEIGVHIADVSWFVDEMTALDEAAKRRATSVYLVHKVSGVVEKSPNCFSPNCLWAIAFCEFISLF